MKTLFKLMTGVLLLGTLQAGAQGAEGSPSCGKTKTYSTAANPYTPLNGNRVLGPVYQASKCGLNYTTATQRLGQRFSPVGVPQPATFSIAGIPAGAVIERAYVWSDASGNGAPFNITVVNPIASSFTIASALVGSDVDKCWGYPGSHTYRADVTSTISGNGNYTLSGFPTSVSSGGTNDIDGATMMVIWSVPSAAFAGDIIIWDGAIVNTVVNGSVSQTINGFNACSSGTFNARAFVGVGDFQFPNNTVTLNGNPPFTVTAWNWWNYVDQPTTVTAGQSSSLFGVFAPGDCYNLSFAGLYYQSNCTQNCFVPCEAKPDFKWDGCNPVQFQGYNNAPANVVSWYWQFGDGQTSTLQNPLHYYGAPGSYKVCLTIIAVGSDGETCCEKICYEVDVCDPQPCKVKPDFFYAISINNPFTAFFFDATTYTGGSICNYQVDFGDGSLVYNGPTMPTSHTYPTTGTFLMCMTVTICSYDANGNTINKCEDKVCKKIVISTNHDSRLAAPQESKEMQVFPNPSNGQVTITITDPNPAQIRVINANGQEVATPALSGKNQYQFDSSPLAQGIYLIIIQSKDGSVQKQAFIRD
jgi:hypothetical protein